MTHFDPAEKQLINYDEKHFCHRRKKPILHQLSINWMWNATGRRGGILHQLNRHKLVQLIEKSEEI